MAQEYTHSDGEVGIWTPSSAGDNYRCQICHPPVRVFAGLDFFIEHLQDTHRMTDPIIMIQGNSVFTLEPAKQPEPAPSR